MANSSRRRPNARPRRLGRFQWPFDGRRKRLPLRRVRRRARAYAASPRREFRRVRSSDCDPDAPTVRVRIKAEERLRRRICRRGAGAGSTSPALRGRPARTAGASGRTGLPGQRGSRRPRRRRPIAPWRRVEIELRRPVVDWTEAMRQRLGRPSSHGAAGQVEMKNDFRKASKIDNWLRLSKNNCIDELKRYNSLA